MNRAETVENAKVARDTPSSHSMERTEALLCLQDKATLGLGWPPLATRIALALDTARADERERLARFLRKEGWETAAILIQIEKIDESEENVR